MLKLIRRFPIITFILCCLIPVHIILWTAFFIGVQPEILKPLKLPFAILPTASAFLISWIIGGLEEVQRLWKQFFLSKTPICIYLVALFIFLLIGG